MTTASKKNSPTQPNDAEEIDQIMNEIEELQQEMNQADASSTKKLHAVASQETILEEFHKGADAPIEESLGDLKDEGTTEPTLLDDDESFSDELEETVALHEEKEMAHTTATNNSNEGSLTMTLNGSMTLKLQYEVEGQMVAVSFVDQTLVVKLADGAEFKIPLHRGNTAKKAA